MPITLSQYWMQLDDLSRSVAVFLILMSLVSWFTIFAKSWSFWRIRRSTSALHAFWSAPTIEDAVTVLDALDVESIYTPMAKLGLAAANPQARARSIMAKTDLSDVMTRVLREELNRVTVRLESGLTLLASIGATAPFVGLLGTVWGIYHALTAVAGSTAIQIDLVAGPVGEALVMTGLGLIVAIPAVLAYNAFNRINRITFAELDGFAFDLHAHLTKVN
ncbi:MotA/TolQ/ExbB proton channel family protein [Undibacterium flavidum]|uniref:Biopolymer transport protein ExbB n=1 Tax=Undibacterium flavidum TaxID=2762297 RepID=A0ABR6YGL6_9BURK|nr:MotA/TolQ/ExbB proton channel family protein [Undibacterium flavidum]MBC3875662.1 MotA/TolQ/ExbB proton channel family protein [Undibacterium flavidum]